MSSKLTQFKITISLPQIKPQTIAEMQGRGGTFHHQGVMSKGLMVTKSQGSTRQW
jgi:hypothetical protein